MSAPGEQDPRHDGTVFIVLSMLSIHLSTLTNKPINSEEAPSIIIFGNCRNIFSLYLTECETKMDAHFVIILHPSAEDRKINYFLFY